MGMWTLERSETTSCSDNKLFFTIYEPKISIYNIYTSQWPFHCLAFKCTLISNLPKQMFQMNNCAKLVWSPCIHVEVMAWWPFYHLTFKCDLDLQPTWTNVSNGTSTPQGQQLCQIILKSMHKCATYDPDKFNLWTFYHLTFQCDLDLQPIWTNV